MRNEPVTSPPPSTRTPLEDLADPGREPPPLTPARRVSPQPPQARRRIPEHGSTTALEHENCVMKLSHFLRYCR